MWDELKQELKIYRISKEDEYNNLEVERARLKDIIALQTK